MLPTTSTLDAPLILEKPYLPCRRVRTAFRTIFNIIPALAAVLTLLTLLHHSWRLPPSHGGSAITTTLPATFKIPSAQKRCDEVVAQITGHDAGKSTEVLRKRYAAFITSAGSFYRGTAPLFWRDMVKRGWGAFNLTNLGILNKIHGNSDLQRTSLWTWITGDQHLNNFGAWQNRHGDVVFGMNDFDEAMIYDFQIDVWRLAVSVYDTALINELSRQEASSAVLTLCDSYVSTLQSYVGNEKAGTFELTMSTTTGLLSQFLRETADQESNHKLLSQYTTIGADGVRRLVRNEELRSVSDAVSAKVRCRVARSPRPASSGSGAE